MRRLEGGDGEGADSEALSLLSYTLRYISLADVGILCQTSGIPQFFCCCLLEEASSTMHEDGFGVKLRARGKKKSIPLDKLSPGSFISAFYTTTSFHSFSASYTASSPFPRPLTSTPSSDVKWKKIWKWVQ